MKFLYIILVSTVLSFGYTPAFTEYNALLNETVCNGSVDYNHLASDKLLDKAKPNFNLTQKEYHTLPDLEKLAYLINAYNFYTLKLIVDNYPVKSIKDLGGVFSSPWSKEFIPLFKGFNNVSLDDIEHKMIRKEFDEPRIHFAVVCASIGCPPLRNEAFTAQNLPQQLQSQAVTFLKDPSKNYIKGTKLYLSKIFDWYGSDFDKQHGSYLKFIQNILDTKHNDIEWLDYDWNLNSGTCK
ncbi:MAG: DUF547 domain-containing protein [Fibrobacterales bacterium]